MTTRRNDRCSISKRLDKIRMTAAEREAARASLEQGMRVADAIVNVAGHLRLIAGALGRTLRGRRERLTH